MLIVGKVGSVVFVFVWGQHMRGSRKCDMPSDRRTPLSEASESLHHAPVRLLVARHKLDYFIKLVITMLRVMSLSFNLRHCSLSSSLEDKVRPCVGLQCWSRFGVRPNESSLRWGYLHGEVMSAVSLFGVRLGECRWIRNLLTSYLGKVVSHKILTPSICECVRS